jgi:hypothetical protein
MKRMEGEDVSIAKKAIRPTKLLSFLILLLMLASVDSLNLTLHTQLAANCLALN